MGGQSGISPKICQLKKGLNTALINLVSTTAIVSHNKVHLFFSQTISAEGQDS